MAAEQGAGVKEHHIKSSFCASRPKYREARWERAVKVYTINLESRFLLIQGVPALDITKDLLEMFAIYGTIDEYRILDDYPSEEFTKVFWIKFKHIMAARKAKRKLDNRSFFGGVLHVSYAPEFESVEETREKLMDRKRIIERKLNYARTHSKSEQEGHNKLMQETRTTAPTTLTTTLPDTRVMSSSTVDVLAHNDVTSEHETGNESAYTPFPPRLPPLHPVGTYPSQVSTMSTSLNTPHTPRNLNNRDVTILSQRSSHAAAKPRPAFTQSSYGYSSNVSFPAKLPSQEVSSTPSSGDLDDFHKEESLTGSLSLDRTVLSIREKLNKVNKRPSAETPITNSDRKKQRKRI